jgi:hypothetical protein
VFCQDIDTVNIYYQSLLQSVNYLGKKLQCFTGLGDEAQIIAVAAQNNTITIANQSLSRNTDILYDKKIGLSVYITSVDAQRVWEQKRGRTGRQGSCGEVFYLLTPTEIAELKVSQEQLDILGKEQRERQEQIFIIMYFLRCKAQQLLDLEQLDKTQIASFWQHNWAENFYTTYDCQFCVTNELDDHYQQKIFTDFCAMIQQSVINSTVDVHELREEYASTINKRCISQATNPISIVQQQAVAIQDALLDYPGVSSFISQSNYISCPRDLSYAEKQQLEIFWRKASKLKNTTANNQTFAQEWTALLSQYQQLAVVAAARSVIIEHLTQQLAKPHLLAYYLGYTSQLSHIASNPYCLQICRSLVQLSSPVDNDNLAENDKLNLGKAAVTLLLDDYLNSSWFINSYRRQSVAKLKCQLAAITSKTDLVKCLVNTQMQVSCDDLAQIESRKWKPLHFFGESRYQSSLSKALKLVDSLGLLSAENLCGSTADLEQLVNPIGESTVGNLTVVKQVWRNLAELSAAPAAQLPSFV